MTAKMKCGAVITAAGKGKRFGGKKQFKKLSGRALLFHSLTAFLKCPEIQEIIVVVPKEDVHITKRELASFTALKPVKAVSGGKRRQDSVLKGCLALSEKMDLIAVHDAARPFVTAELIASSIKGCKKADGCIVALPSTDTVKKVHEGKIERTLDRNTIWMAQTPQTFHREILLKALHQNITATDEASLVELIGGNVAVVTGSFTNFKITSAQDWDFAEKFVA